MSDVDVEGAKERLEDAVRLCEKDWPVANIEARIAQAYGRLGGDIEALYDE